jgi:hypothetical protein
MSDEVLIGKLVRWERGRQWLIARVDGTGTRRGRWRGTVVNPGNYIGLSEFAPKQALGVGDVLPNLHPELLTMIDESASCSCEYPYPVGVWDEHHPNCAVEQVPDGLRGGESDVQ